MDDTEAIASLMGFGISLCFLAYALCAFIDEVKNYLLDRLEEKRRKLLEQEKNDADNQC